MFQLKKYTVQLHNVEKNTHIPTFSIQMSIYMYWPIFTSGSHSIVYKFLSISVYLSL